MSLSYGLTKFLKIPNRDFKTPNAVCAVSWKKNNPNTTLKAHHKEVAKGLHVCRPLTFPLTPITLLHPPLIMFLTTSSAIVLLLPPQQPDGSSLDLLRLELMPTVRCIENVFAHRDPETIAIVFGRSYCWLVFAAIFDPRL
jgi:hypothetical protein